MVVIVCRVCHGQEGTVRGWQHLKVSGTLIVGQGADPTTISRIAYSKDRQLLLT